MTKQEVLAAYRRLVEPELRAAGFRGRRGHLVRRIGGVTQVIELQHSIYGERFTANLGLDLEWLQPVIRWVPRPAIGPHAHDAVRWVRIGLVGPDHRDRWWSYGMGSEGLEAATRALGAAIVERGLGWLDDHSEPASFLEYATEHLERSRSDKNPDGGFVELRLMAAVLAWNGDRPAALKCANRARACWAEEKERLERARRIYRRRHSKKGRLPGVPNLLKELDRLISPTTDEYPFVAPSPAARRRRP